MTNQPFTTYAFEADKGTYAGSGTPVARTTPDRLSDTVNVKDWGAIGNGIADDTNAIRAAINFACSRGQPSHQGTIVFFPPGTYHITSTISLDGSQLGLVHYRGAGRDASIIRGNINSTGAQQEEDPDSFMLRCLGAGSIRDLTVWNESTSPTSGALMMDVCSNSRYVENCHFIGMTGYVCASVAFGQRLTDCIMTCSKSPTLASDSDRSPLYSDAKFYAGYIASGTTIMSGGSVTGFANIVTTDTGNNVINATVGIGFTPNHSFEINFYFPGFAPDNNPLLDKARAHAVASSTGVITTADIIIDHGGSGYSYTPVFRIAHSNIYGGVGAYFGEVLVSNCHATGFDIGFSVIGGATSVKCCSATQCGIGFACSFLNGSRSFGSIDAETSPGRWYLLNAGDLMSCVAYRCTWGIYCYNARGMFGANRIWGSTGPYIPANITGMSYNVGTHVVTVTNPDDHHIANGATIQIDPASLTNDPSGFVTVTTTGGGLTSKQFTYIKSTAPIFTSGTWNYSLEYGIACRYSGGSWFAANTIDAKVSIASFTANGGDDGNAVWCTKGEYGWNLPDNNSDSYGAGVWSFKQCGGGTTLARSTTIGQFPAIPWIKVFPGQQLNIPGCSAPGVELNITTGQPGLSFDDALYVFLTLATTATSGAMSLEFASVPSAITAGMVVDEWSNHTGVLPIGSILVDRTDATHVYLTAPTTAAIGVGARINFLRIDASTHYKTRYDGTAWRVVAT